MTEASSTSTLTSRLRVLCCIGSMSLGGAERQVVEILKRLDRSRFIPELALANRQGELLSEIPADVPIWSFREQGQSVGWTERGGLGRIARWRWLMSLLSQRKIDVVYDRTYLATLDSAPAAWVLGVPRISAAVADPQIQFDLYARRPRWLWRRFSRWAYRTADCVLANSEALREQLLDYWQLPQNLVRRQPNAFDFASIDSQASASPPASHDRRFRILTIGRIDGHKGHADLLSALQVLVRQGQTEIVWQIIGTGPAEASLRRQVEREGLTAFVEFLGELRNPFPFYRAADLFCLPSRTEGSPNVLIEALACGTPVISTDCCSGPREILADGRFGRLVPVGDPPSLARAITEHRAQPELLKEAAEAGSLSVRHDYDADRVIRRLEGLLQDVAQRTAARVSGTASAQN